jgi:hypothetical protein
MSDTSEFPFEPAHSGLYAAPRTVEPLRHAAAGAGVTWCELDLTGVSTKAAFLDCCAAALQFPAGFGRNWDALADCLEDLSWQPAGGIVVHWHGGGVFARRASDDCEAALEIFDTATNYWLEKSRLMLVLLDAPSSGGHLLPALPRG